MLVFQGAKGHSFFIKKKGGGEQQDSQSLHLAGPGLVLPHLFIHLNKNFKKK